MKRIGLYLVVMLAVTAAIDYATLETMRPTLGLIFVVGLVIVIIQEARKQGKKPSA